jgi:predicted permease
MPDTLLQDLRYGARMLFRHPGFTAIAVLALALAIGVNTAVFTGYRAMVKRPLDARDPGRLVNLALVRQSGAAGYAFSYPDYQAYRDSMRSFDGLIAFSPEHMTLSDAGGVLSQRSAGASSLLGNLWLLPSNAGNAELATVFVVSENYFKVLGVAPLRGRAFDAMSASELAAAPSVLIGENYWRRRFASDPAVLGKSMRLNGVRVQVAGITPRDFVGTGVAVPDFWIPLSLAPLLHADPKWLADRENQCCRLFGRLAPGAQISQAQAEMDLLALRLRAFHDPHSEAARPAHAIVWPGSPFPLPLKYYRGLTVTILLIMLAAAMLLVVACANIGSLQLARARSRQDELHVRLSLGASRARLIRQLLTESALLGLLSGLVALALAWAFLQVGVTLLAEATPVEFGTLIFHVNPDLEVFAYVLAVSLAAGILFGLAPALESARSALSVNARGSTSPIAARRLQNLLIAAQVSLSLVLMIAGAMLVHSSIHALHAPTGYDAKHVVDLDLRFPEAAKYTPARRLSLVRDLRARLAAFEGVAAITSAHAPDDFGFQTAAAPLDHGQSSPQSLLYYKYVQPNYFDTLRIPLFLGRGFPAHGSAGQAVILSESAARRLWPGENPIGRSLRLGATDERVHNPSELVAAGPAFQVIGVARDTRGVEFDGSDSAQIYLPLPDDRLAAQPLLIQTERDPSRILRAIDPLLSSLDPDLMATSSTLEDMLQRSTAVISSGFAAAVASSVGLLGLLLALMGIYGTVNYIVLLRTREVGIRMAVGAQKRDILGLILRESTRPVLAGLLAGMFLALGASYLLRGVLYGIDAIDGLTSLGVSLLFLAIALAAAYPPSRRAMRVDPVVALRYE